MKIKELKMFFRGDAIEDATDLNPLVVAESQEFAKKESSIQDEKKPYKTYQQRAIDLVTRYKLWFNSTCNSQWDLMRQYVTVTCPYCASVTKMTGGGGAGGSMTSNYKCTNKDCGAVTSLTLDSDGFSARPKR